MHLLIYEGKYINNEPIEHKGFNKANISYDRDINQKWQSCGRDASGLRSLSGCLMVAE